MSLILEALRKSEAERRRAQVPDLLTESATPAPVAPHAPQRWPLWAAGAVLVLAAAWFATTRDGDPATAPAVSAAQSGPDATDEASAAANEAAAVRQDSADATAAPARPAPVLQRPLVVAAPAPTAPTTATPQSPTNAQPAAPIDTRPPAPPASPARTQAVAAAPASAPAPPSAGAERITDLGSADRKQLPPLKLSMHMWNDVVAQRFVIIDGTRLGVGDRLGAVVVADIVPDGVVLDWNGRVLKLPLR